MLKYNRHSNIYLQRSYNKYGKDNFIFYPLIYIEYDENMLIKLEDWYIKHYDTMNDKVGYNLIVADRHEFTEEHKRKISVANTGRKHTEEARKNMSIAQTGKKQSKKTVEKRRLKLIGKIRPKEATEKTRLARLGTKHTEESKLKMSISQKKLHRKMSEENRKKISIANRGRKQSKEHIENTRLSRLKNSKKIDQLDLDGNYIKTFNSLTEAIKYLGKSKGGGNISNCCKNIKEHNTAYGYKWRYTV